MYHYAEYVSVEKRRRLAERQIKNLRARGNEVRPVEAFHGQIASSFWGKSWCDNLESYADYDYRLARGKSYVRSGCVCHLAVAEGEVEALVNGTELYRVRVRVDPLDKDRWSELCGRCSGRVGSLLDLMRGRLSRELMEIVGDPETGLFPSPREIRFSCSCPDAASMCKHVAAALYGVGRRLDKEPDLLFLLRGVDPAGLLPAALDMTRNQPEDGLDPDALESLFGIELDREDGPFPERAPAPPRSRAFFPAPAAPDDAGPAGPAPDAGAKSAKKTTPGPFNPLRPTGTGIRKLRLLAGLSQAEFARRLQVSVPSVARWEAARGKLSLHQSSLLRLIRFQNDLTEKAETPGKRRGSKT